MVTMRGAHRLAVAWIACGVWLPSAYAGCGGEYEPCERPARLGTVASITIDHSWQPTASSDPRLNCADIAPLDTATVRRYFRRAGRIQAHDALHQVDASPCRASGTLTTHDGRRATWSLGILREATLIWSDAPEPVYLYCSRCQAPFIR